jgi:hypothetical protein
MFRKVVAGLVKADINDFVGEVGNIFFDTSTGDFRLSDGVTPGGIQLGSGGGGGYILPTASTTVKGGVKIDGTTITINGLGVISGFSGNYNNLTNKPTLSTVATSGSYTDLLNKPTLSTVAITGSYTDLLNKPTPYALPTASSTVLGGVKVGTGLEINNGILSVTGGGGSYTLPTASNTVLGGIKVGSGLSIDGSGSLSTSFDGNYNSLSNLPDLSVYQLATTAFDGNYNSLSNLPTLFDGNYNSLSNLPTIPADISDLSDINGLLHPGLEISQIEIDGTVTHSYSNISTIRFDTDSGFDVTDLGSGAVKIGMNSTFKTWKVDGQADLVATGLDTIRFAAGSGIIIETDPIASPKTITFSTTGLGGDLIKTFNILNEFSAPLMGNATFVPMATDVIRSVQLTNSQRVGTDLMIGLYRNNDLLNFFTIPAGEFTAKYTGLNYTITTNDYITVNVVAGSGINFSLALLKTV